MNNIKEILASNIIKRRDELDLTQEKLAEIADISVGMERQLEYKTTWASPETLEKVADGLKTSVAELFTDKSKRFSEPLSLSDGAEILSTLVSTSPERRATILALLFGDTSLLDGVDLSKASDLFQPLLKSK